MARPIEPLISKRETIEVALKLIERDGLDAFNLRRLAAELNVNAASLYHHFANKDEILALVARLALSDVPSPQQVTEAEGDPIEMLIQSEVTYRAALLAHPAIVPLVLQRETLHIGKEENSAWVDKLLAAGITPSRVLPIQSALEAMVLGSVIYEINRNGERLTAELAAKPRVAKIAKSTMGYDDQFAIACRGVVQALLDAPEPKRRTTKPKRSTLAPQSSQPLTG